MRTRTMRLAICLSLTVASAPAGVVFTNGSGVDTGNADNMSGFIEAENFQFGSTTQFTDVHFMAVNFNLLSGYTGSVSWFIYSDNGGVPGSTLSSGNVAVTPADIGPAGGLLTGYEAYDMSFFITPFTATGGTAYWLGLHNGPLSNTAGSFSWASATSGPRDAQALQAPYNGSWFADVQELYFQLTNDASGAVPEPSTFAIMAAGLGCLLMWKRCAITSAARGSSRRLSAPKVETKSLRLRQP
jgi:hypothetical protein